MKRAGWAARRAPRWCSVRRLRSALRDLNPDLPEALGLAEDELTRDRTGTLSLVQANREVYGLLPWTGKEDENRRMPIYLVVRHRGERATMSLGARLRRKQWNERREKVRKSHADHADMNDLVSRARRLAESATRRGARKKERRSRQKPCATRCAVPSPRT